MAVGRAHAVCASAARGTLQLGMGLGLGRMGAGSEGGRAETLGAHRSRTCGSRRAWGHEMLPSLLRGLGIPGPPVPHIALLLLLAERRNRLALLGTPGMGRVTQG